LILSAFVKATGGRIVFVQPLLQIVFLIVERRTLGFSAPGVLLLSGRMTLGSPGPGVMTVVALVCVTDVD
jgi:hypothetical protein